MGYMGTKIWVPGLILLAGQVEESGYHCLSGERRGKGVASALERGRHGSRRGRRMGGCCWISVDREYAVRVFAVNAL